MRLLADALERENIKIEYYDRSGGSRYDRVRLFHAPGNPEQRTVYLIRAEEWKKEYALLSDQGFVICGKVPFEELSEQYSGIIVQDSGQYLRVFDLLQDTFFLFEEWNRNLQMALNDSRPLDRVIRASEKIFRNPMFIHDNYFFVLAHSEQLNVGNIWEKDRRTGRPVVSGAIRNDFQLDQEYLSGLSEKKTVLFSANQRGYQILYHNLYIDGRNVGRVLVDEWRSPVQIGDYDVMEYLAGFLEETIKIKGLTQGKYDVQLDQKIRCILAGQKGEDQDVFRLLDQKGWKREDQYRCMKLIPNQAEAYLVSNTSIIDSLQVLLPDCYTLLYEESAVVIVNMTRSNQSIKEIVAGMAAFLRDSLMKMGISSEHRDFFRISGGYRQSSIALEQGQKSGSMYWYHYFEDYILLYSAELLTRELPEEFLISETLGILKRYDEANHTELFQTLKTYLRLERNLLQTSKTLFVHRSTLSYRIERIQKITGVDLDDEKERLKLLLSFELDEHAGS